MSKSAKPRVYVKPVNTGALFGWVVLEMTIPQSFRDDWRRYGLRTALHNVIIELRGQVGREWMERMGK